MTAGPTPGAPNKLTQMVAGNEYMITGIMEDGVDATQIDVLLMGGKMEITKVLLGTICWMLRLMLFLYLIFLSVESCTTTDRKGCVFPFVYKEIEHWSCTLAGGNNKDFWCATKVDLSTDVYINWDYCSGDCPLEVTLDES